MLPEIRKTVRDSDAQLMTVLETTAQFLHAQGCGEASAAVDEALRRLRQWEEHNPLTWELRGEDGSLYRLTSYNQLMRSATIEPAWKLALRKQDRGD